MTCYTCIEGAAAKNATTIQHSHDLRSKLFDPKGAKGFFFFFFFFKTTCISG